MTRAQDISSTSRELIARATTLAAQLQADARTVTANAPPTGVHFQSRNQSILLAPIDLPLGSMREYAEALTRLCNGAGCVAEILGQLLHEIGNEQQKIICLQIKNTKMAHERDEALQARCNCCNTLPPET